MFYSQLLSTLLKRKSLWQWGTKWYNLDYHCSKPKNLGGKRMQSKLLTTKQNSKYERWTTSYQNRSFYFHLLFVPLIWCTGALWRLMEFQLHATVVSLIIICTWQCKSLVFMTFPVYPEGISLELPTSNKQAVLSLTIKACHTH